MFRSLIKCKRKTFFINCQELSNMFLTFPFRNALYYIMSNFSGLGFAPYSLRILLVFGSLLNFGRFLYYSKHNVEYSIVLMKDYLNPYKI